MDMMAGERAGRGSGVAVRNVWQYGLMLLLVAGCSTNTPATVPPVPTVTALPPTGTSISLPTATATVRPTATVQPTIAPELITTIAPTQPPNAAFLADLQKYPATITSIVGPDNQVYTVYLLSNTIFAPTSDVNCRVYFFRGNGYEQKLIYTYANDAPCEAITWDKDYGSDQERTALSLHGSWSDINQNGLPEFDMLQFSGVRILRRGELWP